MIENAQAISFKPFAGGYVDEVKSSYLSIPQSPYLRNVRINGEGCGPRPGHSIYGDTPSGGTVVRGIHHYKRNASANDKLLKYYNSKLYAYNSSTEVFDDLAVTAGFLTSDTRMNFTGFQDVVFCMNGVDRIGRLTGTTYIRPANVPSNFAPRFSVIFNDIQWAAGWDTNPNILYSSVPAGVTLNADNLGDFTSAGSNTKAMRSRITGLAATLQYFYVFMVDRIDIRTGATELGGILVDQWTTFADVEGAINHESIVVAGNAVFYLTPSNKINVINFQPNIPISQITELSHRRYTGIPNIIKNSLAADQSEAFGYYYEKDQLVLFHMKTVGSTYNDIVIIYDIRHDAFLIDNNKPWSCATINRSGIPFVGSHLNGAAYQDQTGMNDDDGEIAFVRRTKDFDLNNPNVRKMFREMRIGGTINDTTTLTFKIYIDGVQVVRDIILDGSTLPSESGGLGVDVVGEEPVGGGGGTTTLREFVKIVSRGMLRQKGRRIALQVESSGIAQEFSLDFLNLVVQPVDMELMPLGDKN